MSSSSAAIKEEKKGVECACSDVVVIEGDGKSATTSSGTNRGIEKAPSRGDEMLNGGGDRPFVNAATAAGDATGGRRGVDGSIMICDGTSENMAATDWYTIFSGVMSEVEDSR